MAIDPQVLIPDTPMPVVLENGTGQEISTTQTYGLPVDLKRLPSGATVGIDQTANAVTSKAVAGAATGWRAGITAADVVPAPGTVTCTKLTGVGSATAGVYNIFVVAGNAYGRTTAKAGDTTVTTETTNLAVRAAFAQVTGATFYDLYMSTDGVAAKFVGRVTEAQRLSGIILSAVNTTSAGGAANSVDIYVAGTGLAVNAGQLTTNTAFTVETLASLPGAIDPAGAQNLDLNLTFSRTGDSVAPALTLVPFYAMSGGHWAAGDPIVVGFGGQGTAYQPNRQTYRLPVRGRQVVVCVAAISGTGASLDLEYVTN